MKGRASLGARRLDVKNAPSDKSHTLDPSRTPPVRSSAKRIDLARAVAPLQRKDERTDLPPVD